MLINVDVDVVQICFMFQMLCVTDRYEMHTADWCK